MGRGERITARQAALEALRVRRQRQAEREKQIESGIYDLIYSLAQRDQAVEAADVSAAASVVQLLELGLTQVQVVDNIGGALTVKEVARLAALGEGVRGRGSAN